jgi:TldD protein
MSVKIATWRKQMEIAVTPERLKEWESMGLKAVRHLSELGLKFFRQDLKIEKKRDKTLVSLADRSIEMEARKFLAQLTPELGFMGEEFGTLRKLADLGTAVSVDNRPTAVPTLRAHELTLGDHVEEPLNLNTDTYWLLDPIDGTVGFLAKSPLWTTLLSLVHKGKPILGIVSLPCLNEVFVASVGNGARFGTLSTLSDFKPCYTKPGATFETAHASCSDPKTFAHRGIEGWYLELLQREGNLRTHSDAYGYTRVLCGGIDVMLDPIVAPYDVAAVQVLFDETPGAWFSTLQNHEGALRFQMGSSIGAATKELGQSFLSQYARYLLKDAPQGLLPASKKGTKRSFAEKYALPSDAPAFSLEPTETALWLAAMERGVALFAESCPGFLVEDLSVIVVSEESFSAVARNGKLDEPVRLHDILGVQIRAIVAGGTGLVAASLPENEAKDQLVFKALKAAFVQAQSMSENKQHEILAYRDHIIGHHGSCAWGEELDPEWFQGIVDIFQKSQKAFLNDPVQSVQGSVKAEIEHRLQLFLDGSQQTISRTVTRASIEATTKRGEEKRRSMQRIFENRQLTHAEFETQLKANLQNTVDEAVAALDASYTPVDIDYDYLAIDADLLGLILHEALGHAAEGDLITLGSSSFGKDGVMQNLRVAPDWMNIMIDGALDNCGLNLIDAEGTPARRKALVRNGMLVDSIHTRQTAKEAGKTPDGCSRMESVFHPSLNRMTSIWIQSSRELLPLQTESEESIARVSIDTLARTLEGTPYGQGEKGVLFLSGWRGGTASCSNLEFRADVGKVFLLKKGEPPKQMRDANFTGIATECFQSTVAAFGPLLCRSIGRCGKDGQGVMTSDGGPAILLMQKNPMVKVIGTGEAQGEL